MSSKSLFRNSIYKALLSCANIVIPLIIGPYITRLLDVNLYGAYNKAYAEFQVFLIFATFGIYTFGVREISKIRNDKEKVAKTFTNLFVLGIITNTIVGIIFVIYSIFTTTGITTSIYLVFIIQIVANIFYVEFSNEALENYKFITIKTIIVRFLYLILLLTLVKKPDDILLYGIIVSGIVFLNNIISYIFVRKQIQFDFKEIKLKEYIKPLFLVLIMTNIEILYSQLDRVMLGKFVSDVAVTMAYIPYYLVSTLASIPYSIINVSIPRLSYMIESDGKEKYEGALNTSIRSLLFIIIPMCLGVIVLSKEIIFLYAGDKYSNIYPILMLAGAERIIISIQSIMTNLVLYANNKEKVIVKFTLIYGVANLIMNSVLIVFNIFTPFTAILTTTIAETMLVITQYIYIKKKMKINIQLFSKSNLVYLGLSLLFIPVAIITKIIDLGFYINIIAIILICILIYVGVLYIRKDPILNMILDKIFRRLKKGESNG